jgi:hypothetical protein
MFGALDECDTRRRQRRRRLCTACSSSSTTSCHDVVYPHLQQRYIRQKRNFVWCCERRRRPPECHIRNYRSQWKTTLFILWTAMFSYSQADDTSSSSSSPLNLVPTQNYCKQHLITVSSLSILCDTPGAYYSGSNAYRNSPVCVSNDKAKLDIICKCLVGWRAAVRWFSATSIWFICVSVVASLESHGSWFAPFGSHRRILAFLRNLTLALRF